MANSKLTTGCLAQMMSGRDLFLADMLANDLDRQWLKVFLREWIALGEKLLKIITDDELEQNLKNLKTIKEKL